ADRLLLLGQVDDAHAALTDLLQQLVRADARAGALGEALGIDRLGGRIDDGVALGRRTGLLVGRIARRQGRLFQETARHVVGVQEDLDSLPQRRIAGTRLL